MQETEVGEGQPLTGCQRETSRPSSVGLLSGLGLGSCPEQGSDSVALPSNRILGLFIPLSLSRTFSEAKVQIGFVTLMNILDEAAVL